MMKKKSFLALLIIVLITSCRAKNITTTRIEVKPLRNYVLKPGSEFSDTEDFKFMTTEETFLSFFTLTKSSPGSITIPDFNTAAVAAIILPSSGKVITIDIAKAEIAGKSLNIQYSITDTSSFTTFAHTPVKIILLKKDSKVKRVNFFNGNEKKKSLSIDY